MMLLQGWGQFLNLAVLMLLLLIFNSSGNPPYSRGAAGATWRVSFALLIPLVLYVIYYRIYILKELQVLAKAKKKAGVEGELHTPCTSNLACRPRCGKFFLQHFGASDSLYAAWNELHAAAL